ncbi:DNA polymerase III subunit epsilon [Anderseniella sp. Alg231-50]|uniref:DNA polymerase III subunit epsilon n=1 Tax=Anderseniella sp. Alg231-50 TaxID=1922226 RepID=UPI000D55320B
MREIVMDTETTGLDPFTGHRIVEIGAVELLNHIPTGTVYHQYINPQRDMPEEAFNVHGLSEEFLGSKPVFADIAQDFLKFIDDGILIIHNAPFDMKFLNAEFSWIDTEQLSMDRVIDTLALARKRYPMGPNSLDALCRRYGIDNSRRDKHGALLDSELLADVYMELIGGRQTMLGLTSDTDQVEKKVEVGQTQVSARSAPLPGRLSQAEIDAHNEMVAGLGEKALWRSAGSN